MTYQKLKDIIDTFSEEQRNMDVTVKMDGEFHKVDQLVVVYNSDVLDDGHPYLNVQEYV